MASGMSLECMVVMTAEWNMYSYTSSGRNFGREDPGEGVGKVVLGLAFVLLSSQILFD